MSDFDPQELVLRTFLRLRGSRFNLGVGEYMAALRAIEGGFGTDLNSLEETLKLLWCHSLSEQSQFDPIWQSVQAQIKANRRRKPPFPGFRTPGVATPQPAIDSPLQAREPLPAPDLVSQPQPQPKPEMGALPVQAPTLLMGEEDTTTLQAYYPISRRSLVYNWRYLRRPVADGPPVIPDIPATIQQVTRQGFYLTPIYQRRSRNDARLLLLIDQNGSMTPFHHFTRDLVETAQQDSDLDPDNVSVGYFQNVPVGSVFRDAYLTQPLPLANALLTCDERTSVLIVSDAGAARGYRTRDRVRGTVRFLHQLKRYTSLIAWLNPMPKTRWVGSSAEIIANSVPMFQMDNEGLSNAIDVVRGQPLKHSYSASL
ncbi:MAG: VWA domain-containing protein [Leptolyngbya sp. SIO1D8]|nr:VWA domain-containing protein [Leptolyngbya sp. SIO1D8]